MALVASAPGSTAGTIYRYFESKDVLINEVYHYLEERFFNAVMEGYPEDDQVRTASSTLVSRTGPHCINAPLEFRFLEHFHNSPYGAAHRREKLFGNNNKDVITELFDKALSAGIVKDLPLPVLFGLAFGPLLDCPRPHTPFHRTGRRTYIALRRGVLGCPEALSRRRAYAGVIFDLTTNEYSLFGQ